MLGSETYFTFQYGAINTKSLTRGQKASTCFTFQYGAINTVCLSPFVLMPYTLHSNMVQLIRTKQKNRGVKKSTFTFQYGAINTLIAFDTRCNLERFTFQYGAINT